MDAYELARRLRRPKREVPRRRLGLRIAPSKAARAIPPLEMASGWCSRRGLRNLAEPKNHDLR